MLRRLLPYLLMVFLVIIDISVVPVYTSSIFVFSLIKGSATTDFLR